MKKLIVLLPLFAVWYFLGTAKPHLVAIQPPIVHAPHCDSTLWKHVGAPKRLHIIKDCQEMTGTIVSIKAEEDGDYHIKVRPDSKYLFLLNRANKGLLVVEPVCSHEATQKETIREKVCVGFSQHFQMSVGEHVRIVGAWVLDTNHGWNELHPITSLKEEK